MYVMKISKVTYKGLKVKALDKALADIEAFSRDKYTSTSIIFGTWVGSKACVGIVEDLANELKDDFDSRICENCIYWVKDIRMCDNKDSFAYDSKATVVKGDGCNKFKRKDKDNA